MQIQAQIIGNIGADAEVKYAASGTPMLQFNVACNYRERNRDGENVDRTEWVRVTMLGKRGDAIGQYLTKGVKVFVTGALKARPWTTEGGEVRSGLELLANEIEFMSSREGNGQDRPSGQAARPRTDLASVPESALPF